MDSTESKATKAELKYGLEQAKFELENAVNEHNRELIRLELAKIDLETQNLRFVKNILWCVIISLTVFITIFLALGGNL